MFRDSERNSRSSVATIPKPTRICVEGCHLVATKIQLSRTLIVFDIFKRCVLYFHSKNLIILTGRSYTTNHDHHALLSASRYQSEVIKHINILQFKPVIVGKDNTSPNLLGFIYTAFF